MCERIRATYVSISFRREKMMYHGMRNEMPGMSRATRMNTESLCWRKRAMLYAAGRPRRREAATEAAPTTAEFMKYFGKFCSAKTLM